MVKTLAKTSTFEIVEDDNKIIHITFFENYNIDESTAKDYVNVCLKLAGKEKHKILVDMRKVENVSLGAKKKMFDPRMVDITTAAAILVQIQSPLVAVGVSFLLSLSQSPFPTKFFKTEQEAIEWLNGIE